MTGTARRDLRLAEAPVQSEIAVARSAPGVRYREDRIRIPDDLKCNLKWRDYYGQEISVKV